MTPNAEEAILLSGIHADDLRQISDTFEEVGHALMKAIGSEQMIITRGKDGMSIFDKHSNERVPTFAREVFDVTGAGDTVIAAIALAWSSGVPLKESALIANHAAGVVVGKIGCATCDLNELKRYLVAFSENRG
jgi:rfaE bifunctional protein kinase chain/domain